MSLIQELQNRNVKTTPDYLDIRREGLQLLFVYGSLKTGFHNHSKFLGGAHSLGDGVTTSGGSVMYDLGAFPAVYEGEKLTSSKQSTRIFGEVFVVDPLLMLDIDELESNGVLYVRKKKAVTLLDQRFRTKDDKVKTNLPLVKNCWMYFGTEAIRDSIKSVVDEVNYRTYWGYDWRLK